MPRSLEQRRPPGAARGAPPSAFPSRPFVAEAPMAHGPARGPRAPVLPTLTAEPRGLASGERGRRLPLPVRTKMEAAFGHDFSSVRIFEGEQVRAIGAAAYTQGDQIRFAPGRYQPWSPSGQSLLGHELAHVVQQHTGRVATPPGSPIVRDATLEAEADTRGARAAAGRSVHLGGGGSAGMQARGDVRVGPRDNTPFDRPRGPGAHPSAPIQCNGEEGSAARDASALLAWLGLKGVLALTGLLTRRVGGPAVSGYVTGFLGVAMRSGALRAAPREVQLASGTTVLGSLLAGAPLGVLKIATDPRRLGAALKHIMSGPGKTAQLPAVETPAPTASPPVSEVAQVVAPATEVATGASPAVEQMLPTTTPAPSQGTGPSLKHLLLGLGGAASAALAFYLYQRYRRRKKKSLSDLD